MALNNLMAWIVSYQKVITILGSPDYTPTQMLVKMVLP
jgi:hypothetical protein